MKQSHCYKCKKCLNTEEVYFIGGEAGCCSCFKLFIEKGFCKNLRSKCFVERHSPIAVAFSGGPSSLSLLHTVNHTLMQQQTRSIGGKTLNEVPMLYIVYVDLVSIFVSREKDETVCQADLPPVRHFSFADKFLTETSSDIAILIGEYINELLHPNQYAFQCIDPLSIIFDSPDHHIKIQRRKMIQELINCLAKHSCKDMSALEDLLSIIRDRALFLWSQQVEGDFEAVLFGHSADRISATALHYLCHGGGSQISLLSNFFDARYSNMPRILKHVNPRFVRPLKKFSSDQLGQYLSILGEKTTTAAAKIQGESETSILDAFFETAQKANFQTVHTVTQTLEKLSSVCVEEASNPQLWHFPHGRCHCCLGCLESKEVKLCHFKTLSRNELACVGHIVTPTYDDSSQNTHKTMVIPSSQSTVTEKSFEQTDVFLNKMNSLCIYCSNLAVSCPAARDIVFLLVEAFQQSNPSCSQHV